MVLAKAANIIRLAKALIGRYTVMTYGEWSATQFMTAASDMSVMMARVCRAWLMRYRSARERPDDDDDLLCVCCRRVSLQYRMALRNAKMAAYSIGICAGERLADGDSSGRLIAAVALCRRLKAKVAGRRRC